MIKLLNESTFHSVGARLCVMVLRVFHVSVSVFFFVHVYKAVTHLDKKSPAVSA